MARTPWNTSTTLSAGIDMVYPVRVCSRDDERLRKMK
jgi:hypothetical protein